MDAQTLADADTRSEVIRLAGTCDTMDDLARVSGVSRSSIHRYKSTDADFARGLDVARRQRKVLDRVTPKHLPAPAREPRPDPVTARDRAALVSLLWDHAEDPESKGCSKALHVLAEYHLGSEVHAAKLEAARRAAATEDADGPEHLQVRMLVPTPTKHPRVLDAVVVDAKPDSGS